MAKKTVLINTELELNPKSYSDLKNKIDSIGQIELFGDLGKEFKNIERIMNSFDQNFDAFDIYTIEGAKKYTAAIQEVDRAYKTFVSKLSQEVDLNINTDETKKKLKELEDKKTEIENSFRSLSGLTDRQFKNLKEGTLGEKARASLAKRDLAARAGTDSSKLEEIAANATGKEVKSAEALLAVFQKIEESMENGRKKRSSMAQEVAKEFEITKEEAQLVVNAFKEIEKTRAGAFKDTNIEDLSSGKNIESILGLKEATKELKVAQEEAKEESKHLTKEFIDSSTAVKELSQDTNNLKVQTGALTAEEEKAKEVRKENSKMVENLINRYLSFAAAMAFLQKAAREAFKVVSNLDKAFTEMAIVTDYTTKQIWEFYDSFKGIAGITGFTTAEIAGVTAEYLKQGETLSDALILTEAAAKSAQVAGIDTADSVRYLTSAVRGYRLEAENAMLVSDKFAAVAAATATDYDGIATAMSKVAAQAYANGVEMDNLMGLLATAMDVTQEAPENIGTAFKTIFARMTQITDMGKALEDGTDVNKVENALKLVNVALRDSQGNFRKLDDVLMEVGSKWDALNSMQKAYITNTLAGTRQQTRLLAVFENYDKLLQNIQTSQESAGATNAQQAKYMDSLAAAQTKVAIAWEGMISSLSDSTAFIFVLEVTANLLNSITDSLNGSMGPIIKFTGLIAVLGKTTQLTGVGLKRFGDFLKEKNVTSFTSELGSMISAFKISRSEGLKLGASLKSAFSIGGAGATGLIAKVGALASGIGILVAGIGLLTTLYNFFTESAEERTERWNKQISEAEGKLYNIQTKNKGLVKLVEEFDTLNAKIIKTNEDLALMDKLLQQITEMDPENLSGVINEDGTINRLALKALESRSSKEEEEAFKETMKSKLEAAEAFYKDRNIQDENYALAAEGILYKSLGAEKKHWDSVSEYAKKSLLDIIQERMKETERIMTTKNKDGKTIYGQDGKPMEVPVIVPKYSQEDMDKMISDHSKALEEYGKMVSENTSLTVSEVFDKLRSMYSDEETFEDFLKLDPVLEQLKAFANSDIKFNSLSTLSSQLEIVASQINDISDEARVALMETLNKEGIGGLGQYLVDNMNELGLSSSAVIDIIEKLAKTIGDVDFSGIANEWKNLDKLSDSIESINNSLSEFGWGVDSLQEVLDLMSNYPESATIIADAIANNGEIDAETKEAMMKNQHEKVKFEIDTTIGQLEAQLALESMKLQAIDALLEDEYAMKVISASGKVDLEKASAEDIVKAFGEINPNVARALADQLNMVDDFASKTATAIKKAYDGDYVPTGGSIGSSFVPEYNFGRSKVQGSSYSRHYQAQAEALGLTEKPRNDINKFKKDLELSRNFQQQVVDGIKAQLDLAREQKAVVDGFDLQTYKPANSKEKASKGSGGSKGKESDASDKAEYYEGTLNKVYVAEQRVKAAELFMDKSNSMLAFARSVEALGDTTGVVTEGYVQSAKILEDQWFLYRKLIEQKEYLIEALEDEQALLIANLNPALRENFKIINGRIIPVSEKYGKLTAENMEVVDKFAESFNGLADGISEATNEMLDAKTAQNELLSEMRDAVIEWQQLIFEAIKNEEKKYLDSFKKLIDANKKYIADRKKLYEDSFKEEDADKQLNSIAEQRLSLTEKIAALEGAHDQNSLKKKAEFQKQLKDLDEQFNELTLQYNRDAFLQSLDEQSQYQDELYAKEEEAYNERINSADWMEARLKALHDKYRAEALVDLALHDMTIKDLIDAGYITKQTAEELGLAGLTGKLEDWDEKYKEKFTGYLASNNKALEKAWGDKAEDGSDGAQAIHAKALQGMISYLQENSPTYTDAHGKMRDKIVDDWTKMGEAVSNFTNNFDGITLKAPDHSQLSSALGTIVSNVESAAKRVETAYNKMKSTQIAANQTANQTTGAPVSSAPVGNVAPTPKTTPTPTTTTTMTIIRYGTYSSGGSALYETLERAKSAYPGQDIYRYTFDRGSWIRGTKVYTAPKATGGAGSRALPTHSAMATGGITTRTGFHWLDGKPGAPERVLSPGQDARFQELLGNLSEESRARVQEAYNLATSVKGGVSGISSNDDLKEAVLLIGDKIVENESSGSRRLEARLEQIRATLERNGAESKDSLNIIRKYGITLNKK